MGKRLSSTAADRARSVASTVFALGTRSGADRSQFIGIGDRIETALRCNDSTALSWALSGAREAIGKLRAVAVAPVIEQRPSAFPWGPSVRPTVKQRDFKGPHAPTTSEIRAGIEEVAQALAALP